MSRPRRRYGLMTERWGWQPFAWEQNGLPSWRPLRAPAGLVTRRQMREAGLAPGGAEPVAQLVFVHKRREVRASLWDRAELVAKRIPSAAQLVALDKAMAARRWCPSCRRDVGYCVPTSLGECIGCAYPDRIENDSTRTTAIEEVRHAA
jgi:hypothetical protein